MGACDPPGTPIMLRTARSPTWFAGSAALCPRIGSNESMGANPYQAPFGLVFRTFTRVEGGSCRQWPLPQFCRELPRNAAPNFRRTLDCSLELLTLPDCRFGVSE